MERELAINLTQVDFGYTSDEKVLFNVSLQVEKGETIGLIGSNGAGKSTLMKLIVGLEKITSGSITIQGKKLDKKNMKLIRNHVGYVFQEADHQLFMPSVYEDIAFQARQEGKSEKEIDDMVEKILKDIEGEHLRDKVSHRMSGGEKRLATIGVALASSPDILLLDEPTVGLDPKTRRKFIQLLKKRKETKIIATHDMDMVLDLCDRVIVLNHGSIRGDDKPMNIFNNRKLLEENQLEPPLRIQGCPICNNKTN